MPRDIARAARRALELSTRTLGLSGIKIQWCRKAQKADWELEEILNKLESNFARVMNEVSVLKKTIHKNDIGPFVGLVYYLQHCETIFINADYPPKDVAHAVAHECRHLKDKDQGQGLHAKVEEWADEFGDEIVDRMGLE